MRTRLLGHTAAVAAIIALTGCGSSSEPASTDDGCRDVESSVVDEAMSSTKSNFELPDGSVIERLTFDDAASVSLPTEQRKFGAESVMALRVAVFYGGDEADSALSGVENVFYLALDANDQIIAPLASFSEPYFDLAPPSDPGWSEWAEKVDASDTALDAFGCVNPN